MAVKLGYQNVYRDPYGLPDWQKMGFPVQSAPAGLSPVRETSAGYLTVESFQGWAIFWTLLGIFLGGLALNLTPCVYPMIPITVSFFGGRSAGAKPSQFQLVAHGPTIVLVNAEGNERTDLRLVDFLSPEQFLTRMIDLRTS